MARGSHWPGGWESRRHRGSTPTSCASGRPGWRWGPPGPDHLRRGAGPDRQAVGHQSQDAAQVGHPGRDRRRRPPGPRHPAAAMGPSQCSMVVKHLQRVRQTDTAVGELKKRHCLGGRCRTRRHPPRRRVSRASRHSAMMAARRTMPCLEICSGDATSETGALPGESEVTWSGAASFRAAGTVFILRMLALAASVR